MRFLPVLLLALALTACPKKVADTNVAGTDDEQMDQYAAQLEELRTREGLKPSDYCSLKGKVCDISKTVCDIAGKHADRDDFQKRCVASQEDCAHFNEGCSAN